MSDEGPGVVTRTEKDTGDAIRHRQAGRCPSPPPQPAPRHRRRRRRLSASRSSPSATATSTSFPATSILNKVGEFVKQCVREAGGVPFVFNTIGVDDGIAMGHGGMKYSLPSRETDRRLGRDDAQRPLLRRHDLHPQLRQDRARHADGRDALQHPDDLRQRRADGGRQDARRQDGRPDRRLRRRPPPSRTASSRPRNCSRWNRPAARPAAPARACSRPTA